MLSVGREDRQALKVAEPAALCFLALIAIGTGDTVAIVSWMRKQNYRLKAILAMQLHDRALV